MKRLLATILAIFLICTVLPLASIAQEDTTEPANSLTWTLADSTLTISGTGAMADYSADSPAPWYDSRESISSVVISDGVTSIGKYAFYECSTTETMTIPASIARIGAYAFYGCKGLKTITYSGTLDQWNAIKYYGKTGESPIESNKDIYYAKINLSSGSFITPKRGFCGSNITWDIAKDESGEYALKISGTGAIPDYGIESSPWYDDFATISIGDGITRIGNFAFCKRDGRTSRVKSVAIPATVTSIGEGAFSGCDNLESITYCGTKAQWQNIVTDNSDFGNNAVICAAIRCTDGDIEHAASGTCGESLTWALDSSGVLRINGTGAMDSYGIESYTDRYDIEMAPWYPLRDSIQSVIIGDGVTSIGSFAFFECTGLETAAIFGNVETIGYAAFGYCTSMESVLLPKSLTTVQGAAFAECKSLIVYFAGSESDFNVIFESAEIEEMELTTEYLETGSESNKFADDSPCTWSLSADGMLKVEGTGEMPDFAGNAGTPWADLQWRIRTVTIGEGVASISGNAFSGCSALKSITIPGSVTSIGENTLSDCEYLAKIVYKSTAEAWNKVSGSSNVPMDKLYYTYHFGDADGDNKCTAEDCVKLFKYLKGESTALQTNKLPVVNINNDATVDIGDLQMLYRYTQDAGSVPTTTLEVKAG